MQATCGNQLIRPINGKFIAQQECPSLKISAKMIQNGIQSILKKCLLVINNHSSGIVKASLPTAFAEKFVAGDLDGSIIPETATSTVTCRNDGVYEIQVVNDMIMMDGAEMGLRGMESASLTKVKYFATARSSGSLTKVLAEKETIPDNWNFNNLDDLLPQTSSTLFESAGSLRAFSPELCNLPTCNLNICPDGKKIWYTISESDKFVLIEYLKSQKLATCNSPLDHGIFAISLELFQKLGITVYKTVQEFGDLIIVKPGALFQTIAIHNTISENVAFYAMGYEECAIRNKLCKCVDRPRMTDDEMYIPSLLIGSILYKAQKAIYGVPWEEYVIPYDELPPEREDETLDHENVQTSQEERDRIQRTPNRPINQSQQNQTDVHAGAKKRKAVNGQKIPAVGTAKRRVNEPANNAPAKRGRVNNRAKFLYAPERQPCEEGCACARCLIRRFKAENNLPVNNTDQDNDASEGGGGFDSNDAGEDATSNGQKADEADDDSSRRLMLIAHPQMLKLRLEKKMIHFEKYLKPCPPEKRRQYEANRKGPKAHTDPRGLLTWLTNNISVNNNKLKDLQKLRKAFAVEFDEDEFDAILQRKNYLVETRQAFRILKQLFCLERGALTTLIASGYSIMGIFRDFIDGSSEIHLENYRLAVDNAFKSLETESKNGWKLLGSCKKLWWKKFGLDNRYVIPWQRWTVEEPTLAIPETFAHLSQEERADLENPCLCYYCAHTVQCNCFKCELKKKMPSIDMFASNANPTPRASEIPSIEMAEEQNVNVGREHSTADGASHESTRSPDSHQSETNDEPVITQQSTYNMTNEPSQPPFFVNYCYDETTLPVNLLTKIREIRGIQAATMFRFTNKRERPSDEIFGKTAQINLDQLQDGSYIGENLVDNYIDLLVKDTFDPEAIILKSVFSERNELNQRQLLQICDMFNYCKWILIPMLDASHWRLFVLDIHKKEHFVYDPLGHGDLPDSVQRKIENVMSKLSQCLLHLKVFTQYSSQPINPPELPLQPNMYDCGIFMLQVLRQLNSGVTDIQVYVPFARELILSELIQDKLVDLY